MPTEKNAWDIDRLKETVAELKITVADHARELRDYEQFKAATVEKLLIIFQRLEELQEGDRWIKRLFISTLITTTVSAFGALIVWAFKN